MAMYFGSSDPNSAGARFPFKIEVRRAGATDYFRPNSQTNYPPTSLATRCSGLILKALRSFCAPTMQARVPPTWSAREDAFSSALTPFPGIFYCKIMQMDTIISSCHCFTCSNHRSILPFSFSHWSMGIWPYGHLVQK